MNQRLTNVICWMIGSIFCVLNVVTGDEPVAWAVITVISVYNTIRQYKLYQDEKGNGHG